MTVIFSFFEYLGSLDPLWLKLITAVVLFYVLVIIMGSGWIANNLRKKFSRDSIFSRQKTGIRE